MSEDLMLKCLIAFILGWIVCRMMGDGFSVGADEDPDGHPMCQHNRNTSHILNSCSDVPDDDDCKKYVMKDSSINDWKPGMKLINCDDRIDGVCTNDDVGCEQDCSNVCNNNGNGDWNPYSGDCECYCDEGYSGMFCDNVEQCTQKRRDDDPSIRIYIPRLKASYNSNNKTKNGKYYCLLNDSKIIPPETSNNERGNKCSDYWVDYNNNGYFCEKEPNGNNCIFSHTNIKCELPPSSPPPPPPPPPPTYTCDKSTYTCVKHTPGDEGGMTNQECNETCKEPLPTLKDIKTYIIDGADEDPMCQHDGNESHILNRCTYNLLPNDPDCKNYVMKDPTMDPTDWKPGMKLYNCGDDRWEGKCSNDNLPCKQNCKNVCNNNGTESWNKETRECDCKCNQGYSGRFCETDIAKEKKKMEEHIKKKVGRANHFSDIDLNKYCKEKDLKDLKKIINVDEVDESYMSQLRLNFNFCPPAFRTTGGCDIKCNKDEHGMRLPYTDDLKSTCLRKSCIEGKYYFPTNFEECWTIDDIIDKANCKWNTDAEPLA